MLISRSGLDRRNPGFAWWRMLVWVLLLLAAFGGVQYIHHAQQVWSALQALPPGDQGNADTLHGMLGWDMGYLAGALVVIAACAGCILRQAWARPVLRVIALLLCVWSAYRGLLLWQQWRAFDVANAALVAGGQSVPAQLADLQRIMLAGLGVSIVAVPILLWLAWQLGHPAVRLQFRPRRA
jgi:hypothetical protein